MLTRSKANAFAAALCVAAALAGCVRNALAQNLESAIMPGELIRGHIKQESDCKNCHVRFDRAAQPRLCMDCHKEVGADVRNKQGYHGRLKDVECRRCHTEHKGREARIVNLDEKTFDHAQTDFLLKDKHRVLSCAKCHLAGKKHSAAASSCGACHRKDDKHKDSLGPKCDSCHSEKGWKETRFDHAKTKFPLLFRHEKVKCAECHADAAHFANTARECVSCHRKDDKHKDTLGAKCESCHSEKSWKEARFDHAKTRFPLLLRHANVKCAECHADLQHFAKTARDCVSCHRKNDTHKGTLGTKCDACHTEKSWKEALRFDHDRDTRFPLRDKHRDARCEGCHQDARHKGGRFQEKLSRDCYACHERDDREKGHKGRYGQKCESCHVEKSFKSPTFEHERDAKFVLRGMHEKAKCDSCHKGDLYRDKLGQRCFGCHAKDDKHKAQLGEDCAKCHNERGWKEAVAFDHNRSRFPLLFGHAKLECRKCHASPAFKDARIECVSCHAKDDFHKERLGPKCEDCHKPESWKRWDFDHNLRSRFKLVEAHAKAKCLYCHQKPVKDRITLATDCYACHRQDDIHLETKGTDCERCHFPDDWRKNHENAQTPGRKQ